MLTSFAPRIEQREHPEYLVTRLGHRDHPVPVADRPLAAAGVGEDFGPSAGRRSGIRLRAIRARPGTQVAEAVLHRDPQPGELVQCIADTGLTGPRCRDSGERLVDLPAAFQIDDACREPVVGLRQLGVQGAQLTCGFPVSPVQSGRGERTAGLLREHPQQEELVLRRSGIRVDDEIPGLATDGAQGVGTGPHRAGGGDPAVGAVEFLEAAGELWPVEYVAVRGPHVASADQEAGDGAAGSQRGDRGDSERDDLRLVASVGHHHRQHEQVAQVRKLLTECADPLSIVHHRYSSPSARSLGRPWLSRGSRPYAAIRLIGTRLERRQRGSVRPTDASSEAV